MKGLIRVPDETFLQEKRNEAKIERAVNAAHIEIDKERSGIYWQ
jgi:hypothetical protein